MNLEVIWTGAEIEHEKKKKNWTGGTWEGDLPCVTLPQRDFNYLHCETRARQPHYDNWDSLRSPNLGMIWPRHQEVLKMPSWISYPKTYGILHKQKATKKSDHCVDKVRKKGCLGLRHMTQVGQGPPCRCLCLLVVTWATFRQLFILSPWEFHKTGRVWTRQTLGNILPNKKTMDN